MYMYLYTYIYVYMYISVYVYDTGYIGLCRIEKGIYSCGNEGRERDIRLSGTWQLGCLLSTCTSLDYVIDRHIQKDDINAIFTRGKSFVSMP